MFNFSIENTVFSEVLSYFGIDSMEDILLSYVISNNLFTI